VARRGFLSRLLGVIERAVSPVAREEYHRKQEREFRRGKRSSAKVAQRAAEREKAKRADRNLKARRKREEQRSPYEREWREQQPGKRFKRRQYEGQKRTFDSLPGMSDETEEDRQDLWHSYLENMVYGRHGYKFNDLRNPWWDDANMHPNQFDWDEWRRWRDTPK
jgi:hypothetical protein